MMESEWAKRRAEDFDFEPSKLDKPYWMPLAYMVRCPKCNRRVGLCVKPRGKRIYYQWHDVGKRSGFVNPMVYAINIVECSLSHTLYDGKLPMLDGEGQLRSRVIASLILAKGGGNPESLPKFLECMIKWLREYSHE